METGWGPTSRAIIQLCYFLGCQTSNISIEISGKLGKMNCGSSLVLMESTIFFFTNCVHLLCPRQSFVNLKSKRDIIFLLKP